MSTFVDEDEVKVSLCHKCACHPSLKQMILNNFVPGLCAVCEEEKAQVYDLKDSTPMVMLIRALIRFHWDEHAYNPHWGGDTPMTMLTTPGNPILKPFKSNKYYDELGFLIEEPVYPAYKEGVCLYAGHDEGVRGMLSAISRTTPETFHTLRRRLLTENFFQVEPSVDEVLSKFLSDIEAELPKGELWYRARLGQAARYASSEGWESKTVRQPLMGDAIGAPPPLLAGNGRLNRAGVSMLYLATDPYTAVAEIRPHPGHYVSIGGFRSKQSLKLADFNPDIAKFSSSDARLDLYEMIQAFDRLMSMPVTPDEKRHYLLTQLVAEVLIKKGFDGVRFRSSVSDGSNICIFYPERFVFDPSASDMRMINSVTYDATLSPSVIQPTSDLYKLDN